MTYPDIHPWDDPNAHYDPQLEELRPPGAFPGQFFPQVDPRDFEGLQGGQADYYKAQQLVQEQQRYAQWRAEAAAAQAWYPPQYSQPVSEPAQSRFRPPDPAEEERRRQALEAERERSR